MVDQVAWTCTRFFSYHRNRNVFNLFILKYIFSWSSLHGERFLLKIIIKIDKKLFVTFNLNINNMKLSYWPVDVATILINFGLCYGSSHFTVYFLKRVLKRLAILDGAVIKKEWHIFHCHKSQYAYLFDNSLIVLSLTYRIDRIIALLFIWHERKVVITFSNDAKEECPRQEMSWRLHSTCRAKVNPVYNL